MLRAVLVACLVCAALSTTLQRAGKNKHGYCYGYEGSGKSWCWLTFDGLKDYASNGQGGYQCTDFDGYSSDDYCKDAKAKKAVEAVHRSANQNTGSVATKAAHVSTSGSPWSKYLASLTGKSSLDWKEACGALGQQPAGYGMSGGGGKSIYSLTCNSNHIKVTCSGSPFTSCTSDYNPPATIADAQPIAAYQSVATAGSCGSGALSQKEVQEFLDIHNKMRCAVGAPAVAWDAALQCQAQTTQNEIGEFKHSKSYDLPIPAGENLATGTNVATAAWMWFLEYTQSQDYSGAGDVGHFTAMTWKSVTHIGCGIQRSGKGVIRCQYRGSPLPNMAGDYDVQLNKFDGDASDFLRCKMPIAEVKSQAKMQQGWGILHPAQPMSGNLGLYSMTDTIWSHASSAPFLLACAFVAAAAMVSLGLAVRRFRSSTRTIGAEDDSELLACEAADVLE